MVMCMRSSRYFPLFCSIRGVTADHSASIMTMAPDRSQLLASFVSIAEADLAQDIARVLADLRRIAAVLQPLAVHGDRQQRRLGLAAVGQVNVGQPARRVEMRIVEEIAGLVHGRVGQIELLERARRDRPWSIA